MFTFALPFTPRQRRRETTDRDANEPSEHLASCEGPVDVVPPPCQLSASYEIVIEGEEKLLRSNIRRRDKGAPCPGALRPHQCFRAAGPACRRANIVRQLNECFSSGQRSGWVGKEIPANPQYERTVRVQICTYIPPGNNTARSFLIDVKVLRSQISAVR